MNALTALIILTAIQIGASFAATAVMTISPLLADSLGVSAKWIGLYTAVLYAAAAWSSIHFGNRVHRLGAFRVSRLCLALCAAAMLLMASAHVLAVLASAVLMGLGYGGITPASSYFLSQSAVVRNRSLLFSIRQSGVPAGAALAAVLMPPMTAHLGLAWAFVVPGVLGLLAAAAFGTRSATAQDNAAPTTTPAPAPASAQSSVWSLLSSHRPLRLLALVAFVFSGLQVTTLAMLVPFLHDFLDMRIEQAAMLLTVLNLVGVVFRLLWGRCVDRGAGALQMLGLSGLLGAVGFAVLAWSGVAGRNLPMLLLAAAMLGMAVVAWNGVLFSEIAAIVPREQVGQATGLCVFAGFIGVVIMPTVLTQAIAQRSACAGVFALGAVLCLGMSWLTTRQHRRKTALARK